MISSPIVQVVMAFHPWNLIFVQDLSHSFFKISCALICECDVPLDENSKCAELYTSSLIHRISFDPRRSIGCTQRIYQGYITLFSVSILQRHVLMNTRSHSLFSVSAYILTQVKFLVLQHLPVFLQPTMVSFYRLNMQSFAKFYCTYYMS